jgi:hypothetical protein
MDLNEFLETIIEVNIEKPWGIVVAQVVFDSFRKYCIEYIQETKVSPIESLYELVLEYTDESFKKYVDEIFQAEHFEQFDTQDLCLEFFNKFITILSTISKDELNEDKVTDFLDYNIYKYFEIVLSDNQDFWFFPYTYEDDLHIDTYEHLRLQLIYKKDQGIPSKLMNEPIEKIEELPIKKISHAIIKNKHKQTKKHVAFKGVLHFSKTKKLRK